MLAAEIAHIYGDDSILATAARTAYNMYRICDSNRGTPVKTTTIPPLRVPPDLRKKAEAVLKKGESLSGFMLDALTRNIEYRQMRHEFIARGIASGEAARKSGVYVSADKVIGKLARRLAKAKRRGAR